MVEWECIDIMIKHKKRKLIIRIFIVCVAVIIIIAVCQCCSYIPLNEHNAEKTFQRDKSKFNIMVDFFSKSDYSMIIINESYCKEGTMLVGNKLVDIKDDRVLEAINSLLGICGYESLAKYGNTIYFEKWRVFDATAGIAYNIDESKSINIQYLTKSIPLSQSGWYYYRTDNV